MRDLVVLSGDEVTLPGQFDDCTVSVTASKQILAQHGQIYIANKRVCVLKDAAAVRLPATYTTAAFVTPGGGEVTLQVTSAAQRSYAEHEPLLLKGDSFTAVFSIVVPATSPSGASDVPRQVPALGSFQPAQFFVHAS